MLSSTDSDLSLHVVFLYRKGVYSPEDVLMHILWSQSHFKLEYQDSLPQDPRSSPIAGGTSGKVIVPYLVLNLSRIISFIPHIILSITCHHTHLNWFLEEIIMKERHLPKHFLCDEVRMKSATAMFLLGLDIIWECEHISARNNMCILHIYIYTQ